MIKLKGKSVFIRTVTHHHVGRVVAVTKSFIILEEASWVADSGRFSQALEKGTLNEVERMTGQVFVSRGALIDIAEWSHTLPVATK